VDGVLVASWAHQVGIHGARLAPLGGVNAPVGLLGGDVDGVLVASWAHQVGIHGAGLGGAASQFAGERCVLAELAAWFGLQQGLAQAGVKCRRLRAERIGGED
jgi:hypothetical protein